jgi:CBS domain-containing protein
LRLDIDMQIARIMTRPVTTCHQTDTLEHAVQLMWDRDIGFLPVVDDLGMLVGVVTDRDACMAAMMQHLPLDALSVPVAMNKHVVTCRDDDTAERAAELMAKHKIRRIPIIDDDDRPVGVLALNDLALAAGRERLSEREVARTLGAICEHRPLAA